MKKDKIDISEQQECIEKILMPLIRRNIDYNPIATEFENAMDENNSIRNFLDPFYFSNQVEKCLIELKENKDAQNIFMTWVYNRLTNLVLEWCPYTGSYTGDNVGKILIEEIAQYYRAYDYFFYIKNNPIL